MSTHAPSKPRQVQHAQVGGEKVARSEGFEWLARAGFVARGLIYGIIGILAIKLAIGAGGTTTNQQGAMKTIAAAAVREGAADPGRDRPGGLCALAAHTCAARSRAGRLDSRFERVAAFGSGVVYAGLCAIAVEILLGSSSSGSSSTHKTTAGVLGWPAGTWLVGFAGVVLIGIGLFQGYRGLSKDFLKDSKTEQMSARGRALDRVDWHLRPPRSHGRVRARRRLPDQSRRSTTTRTRRSVSTARSPRSPISPTGRSCSASSQPDSLPSASTRSATPATAASSWPR